MVVLGCQVIDEALRGHRVEAVDEGGVCGEEREVFLDGAKRHRQSFGCGSQHRGDEVIGVEVVIVEVVERVRIRVRFRAGHRQRGDLRR